MILTLTLNPAIDLTYALPALTLGTSHRVPQAQQRAGGKGVNVARVLTEQGYRTRAMAPVGGTTGAQFRADLDRAGIDHQLLPVQEPTRRTITLVTPEHTTPLNEAGQSPTATELDQLLQATAAALAGARVLVCSGSVPAGAPADLIPSVIALARAAGVPVIVDTSGPALLAAVESGADVLKPNQDELREIAGPAEPSVAARSLAERSGGAVFASLGAGGMLATTAAGPIWHARLPQPLSGNPTGAGDAAVAAIAVGLARHGSTLEGDSLPQTLRTATAWSAAAVLTPTAGSIADPAPLTEQIIIDRVAEPANPEESR